MGSIHRLTACSPSPIIWDRREQRCSTEHCCPLPLFASSTCRTTSFHRKQWPHLETQRLKSQGCSSICSSRLDTSQVQLVSSHGWGCTGRPLLAVNARMRACPCISADEAHVERHLRTGSVCTL